MLLYAQALIWGNSCFALGITGIYRSVRALHAGHAIALLCFVFFGVLCVFVGWMDTHVLSCV